MNNSNNNIFFEAARDLFYGFSTKKASALIRLHKFLKESVIGTACFNSLPLMVEDTLTGTIQALFLLHVLKNNPNADEGATEADNANNITPKTPLMIFLKGLLVHLDTVKLGSDEIKSLEDRDIKLNDDNNLMKNAKSLLKLFESELRKKLKNKFQVGMEKNIQELLIFTYCHKYNDKILFFTFPFIANAEKNQDCDCKAYIYSKYGCTDVTYGEEKHKKADIIHKIIDLTYTPVNPGKDIFIATSKKYNKLMYKGKYKNALFQKYQKCISYILFIHTKLKQITTT